jgi:peptidoglycan hydrolase CwlO-like protein|tara:strand:+ start:1352 stop:1681 length:330 start_codon:yes stop_codon:yes gene_type:complete
MTREKRRSTDVGWQKFITVEILMGIGAIVFVAGGIWVTLSSDISYAQSSTAQNSIKLQNLARQVASIDTDLRVIAADAEHNKDTADEIKADLKEQRTDIKEILRILGNR